MTKHFQKYLGIILLFAAFSISGNVFSQYDVPEKPKEQTSVYDYIDLLSPAEKSSLENKLIRHADSTSTQIVFVIIASTKGEDISLLGAKWGQAWGIGQAKEDNGVLVIL